jgi:hypothetical protein
LVPPLALGVERRLRDQSVAEARERAEQRVDLEQRVRALLGRLDGELEIDLIAAVADPQTQPRRLLTRRMRRVLDEDADLCAAGEPTVVETQALVDTRVVPGAARGRRAYWSR